MFTSLGEGVVINVIEAFLSWDEEVGAILEFSEAGGICTEGFGEFGHSDDIIIGADTIFHEVTIDTDMDASFFEDRDGFSNVLEYDLGVEDTVIFHGEVVVDGDIDSGHQFRQFFQFVCGIGVEAGAIGGDEDFVFLSIDSGDVV